MLKEARSQAADLLAQLEQEKVNGAKNGSDKVSGGEVAARYERLLSQPGTPEKRKAEILSRLAELYFKAEEQALLRSYEEGSEMDIPPGERYPKSLEYYERLVEEYPESPQALTAYYNMGYLYRQARQWEKAGNAYKLALELDPDLSEAKTSLALCEQGFTSEK